MAWIYGYHKLDDNQRMGKSKDGGLSANIFDENGVLMGQSAFHPVSGPEDYKSRVDSGPGSNLDLNAVVAQVIVLLAVEVSRTAAPYIERWLKDHFLPALKTQFARLRNRLTAIDENSAAGELEVLKPMIESDPTAPQTRQQWMQWMAVLQAQGLVGDRLVEEINNSKAFDNATEVGWATLFKTLSKQSKKEFRALGDSAKGYLEMRGQLEGPGTGRAPL